MSHGFLAAVGWWLAGFENTRQGSGLVHCEFWKMQGKMNAVRMSDLFAANVFDCVNCVSK